MLTKTQIESFRDAGEALQERKPVLLTGNSNGKTTILHSALEVLGQRDEKTGFYSTNPRHPEDRTIDFYRVYLGYNSHLPQVMKMVLAFSGRKPKRFAADAVMQYDDFMREMSQKGRAVCLAVDNAELLPARAYTVLKALNEYHDPLTRKSIGAGLLIAGNITKLKKMPASFMLRAKEILVGRIGVDEITGLIEALYPHEIRWFGADAMKRIAVCNTTLQMKSVIERCVADRKRYRLTEIGRDMVEEKMSDLPNDGYKLAQAA